MVLGIYERADGIVYVDLVADASGAEVKLALRENVSIDTTVYSDTHGGYRGLNAEFAGHETISHRTGEYVHGVADDHFLLFLKEVEYRFNRRELSQEAFVNHVLSQVLLS